MYDNYHYPMGVDTPSAPWNEPMIPEREFNVCAMQTLVKETTISTDQYWPECDEENGHIYANTDNTDWKDVYEEVAYTPIMLIDVCKKIAQWAIDNGTSRIGKYTLEDVVDACNDWEVDETTVEEL